MANININIGAKVFINFSPLSVEMNREVLNTKPVVVNYTQGNGQTLPVGTVLTYGTPGAENYTELTFSAGATFSGTGSVNATLTATPGSTVLDQAVTFVVDGSTITVNINYNSNPVVQDIDIDIPYANTKTFTLSDFTDATQGDYEDFDGDALAEVMISGSVAGYFYPNTATPLVAGTWIPVANIVAGQLTFKGDASEIYGYSSSVPYKAKDAHGNISN